MPITTFPTAPLGYTPANTLAYAQITANQSGIGSTPTAITGLSVTVVVAEGRRIRISGHGLVSQQTAGGIGICAIYEGALRLNEDAVDVSTGQYWTTNVSHVLTPAAGAHTYTLMLSTTAGTTTFEANVQFPGYILVEDITGQPSVAPPGSVPVGQLGYAQAVANQGSITTEVDLTGLSVNVVVPAGRVLRVTGSGYFTNTGTAGVDILKIFQDGTQVCERAEPADVDAHGVECVAILSPSAGAHTYKLRAVATAGTGTSNASATFPAFILVEDVSPTPAPANSAPSSTLGYAEVVAGQGSITSEVDLTGLSVTVTVPVGRRLRVTGFVPAISSTVSTDVGRVSIKEGAALLQLCNRGMTATYGDGVTVVWIGSPSAGTHTYKLAASRVSGTGTLSTAGDPTYPAFILVEDITAVSTYAINPLSIVPGTFQAGDYVVPGSLVVSGDGPLSTAWSNVDQLISAVGRASSQFVSISMVNQSGALSASNLMWWWRADKTAKTHTLFGYDGTTVKAFLTCDYPNGRIYLEDKPLRVRAYGDGAHGLQYTATLIDGPLLYGNSGAALGDTNNGWDFRAMGNGDCYARGGLFCGNISNNGVIATAQGKGYAQARFHFSGDGNDMHHNWGGGYQIYVDVTNVKTFVIPHPTDNERYLVHACVEGPEALVQYRGQSQLEGGWVEIELPAYFEALCAEEGRSVQVTCIADDPADEWCPVLHATYPKNGKFYVGLGSGMVINDQRFWWEVKAVRKDVPPVNVEPLKDTVDVLGSGPYTYAKEK